MRVRCKPNREHPVTRKHRVRDTRQMKISSLARANNEGIVTRISKFTTIPRIEPKERKKFYSANIVHVPHKVSPLSKFNDLSTEESSMVRVTPFSRSDQPDIASRISSFVDIDSGESGKVGWETGLRGGKVEKNGRNRWKFRGGTIEAVLGEINHDQG